MNYLLYFFLGLLPSIIWLLFYLRKDVQPENNQMVLKIFFFGMLIAIPALFLGIFLERGVFSEIKKLNLPPILITISHTFLGVALVEEALKYLVVREKVLKHPELDEPVDALLYMIIAALGFAASENILILFTLGPTFLLSEILVITLFRFLGATFLHALASGTFGYFLALAIFETKKRLKLILLGLGISTFLHGFYNFSIIEIEGNWKLLSLLIILIGSAFFLTLGFKKLHKMKSVCKI